MLTLWAVATLALLVAVLARRKSAALHTELDGVKRDQTVRGGDLDELRQGLDGLRRLTGLMASGQEVDAAMVKENRLYRSIQAQELQQRFADGGDPYVIDVRSDQEWAGGHISNAAHIPLDAIKDRLNEVARDGREIHVICAMGQRSAAAADYLSTRGFLKVFNVEGGMNSWRGEVIRG